jgi:hypothetical protein
MPTFAPPNGIPTIAHFQPRPAIYYSSQSFDLPSCWQVSNGVEVYAWAGVQKFGLMGGFISQDPDVKDPLLNPDFRNRYLILGVEWFFAKSGKIDIDSVGPTGDPGFSVFTIGFRYDFSWRISRQP